MPNKFQDIAFTDSVKKAQEHYGSRRHYAKFEAGPDSNDRLGDVEADFIEARDGFYLATVGESGQPYVQFRGGHRGFLNVIDDRTLGWADFRGNLQYISVGNASANRSAALFLMDYANRRRLKLFGQLEFIDASEQPDLIATLADPDYEAKVERVALFEVKGFDWNCPQHITPRYTMEEVKVMIQPLYNRIGSLELELAKYKGENDERIS
ncbi:MAG TPA: pyridoxamine 5'-phosphate oxidase family protein [Pyrinomonadaceae bacterium]